MQITLTKRVVAQAKPQAKPYELRDILVRGLILRVQPSGYKAWIVTWQHGKRRTLGAVDHLTLEQARAHASQAVAEAVQQRLPALATIKQKACTLGEFLDQHYEPWATTELRRGARYVQRIKFHFGGLLDTSLTDIDTTAINKWWRDRLSNESGQRQVQRATAHRDFATLRAALSKAVEWKLIERNPLFGIRQKAVQSRKIVRFLSTDEEHRLRSALRERDRSGIEGRANANAARRRYGQPVLPDLPHAGFVDHLSPVVLLAMNTGMRRGELLSLDWTDINWTTKVITIRACHVKNGKQRHIPMNAEVVQVLDRTSCVRNGLCNE